MIELTEQQQRLLAACKEKHENPLISLRELASKYDVPCTTLHRSFKLPTTAQAIIGASAGRGRKQRLHPGEEQLIAEAVIEFQAKGTPLSRDLVLDVAETPVQTLPSSRRCTISFVGTRPGRAWLSGFLRRYPNLKVQTTADLEHDRAEAMSPERVAEHFAHIRTICDKYAIKEPAYVFNFDECGFSVKGMTWGRRVKRVVAAGSTSYLRTLKWQGSIDHVTLMTIVSAAGQAFTPVSVLTGELARYKRQINGNWETPADFLPNPNYVFMREVAGIDGNLFYTWAVHFVRDTSYLRQEGKQILLVYDGYCSHCSYRTLKLFRENDIIDVRLPSNTSHALKPLYVRVFSPLKNFSRKVLCTRAIVTKRTTRNDIFTVCELLKKAQHDSVVPNSIVGGFQGSGLWVQDVQGPDQSRIKPVAYTTGDTSELLSSCRLTMSASSELAENQETPLSRVHTARNLYNLFLSNAEQLLSDGTVTQNGLVRVLTIQVAILMSEKVIEAAKQAARRKAADMQNKAAAAATRERRLVQKTIEHAQKTQKNDEREDIALLKMKAGRALLRDRALIKRAERRAIARNCR